jgi:GTP-binding protein YchF
MLSVGIVGLPNVGKSTLFNALTAAGAEVSNYPFTTIEPNVGVVPVPDPRLDALAGALSPEETTPAFVRFVDIAGLVAGASHGEGLGNQFLGEIRAVDAVAHVVRCFPDPDVVHVAGQVDPLRDLGVLETELLLADLEVLERAIEKRKRQWQTRPQDHAAERARLEAWQKALADGTPLSRLALDAEDRREAKALGLLTAKPVLWVANVGEEGYGSGASAEAAALHRALAGRGGDEGAAPEIVELSARLEAELAELAPEDRAPFLADLGLATSGLERLAEAAFHLLHLVRFYTVVSGKLRAWEVPGGATAPQAAGRVHSDMEEGFIRARVADWQDVVEAGGFADLVRHGKVRTEGKEYLVRDGDVVEFLFHE